MTLVGECLGWSLKACLAPVYLQLRTKGWRSGTVKKKKEKNSAFEDMGVYMVFKPHSGFKRCSNLITDIAMFL